MYFKALFGAFAALLLALGNAQAQQQSAATELTGLLEGYKTFQADFEQTVTDEQGQLVQESAGRLRAKRDGLFYWHVQPPLEQYIAADGEQVEVYDPDLEQVTIYPMDEKLTATPALLLSGNVEDLDQAYEVTRVKLDDDRTGYRLEPKDPDSLFVSLTMVFDGGFLKEMRLQDSLQQSSMLKFSNVEINEDIPDSAFELEYPEHVDVIRNQAAP